MQFKSLAFFATLQIRRQELQLGAKGLLNCSGNKIREDPHSCLLSVFEANRERARMVEAFCATWKLTDSQNFDEYMKALGEKN